MAKIFPSPSRFTAEEKKEYEKDAKAIVKSYALRCKPNKQTNINKLKILKMIRLTLIRILKKTIRKITNAKKKTIDL